MALQSRPSSLAGADRAEFVLADFEKEIFDHGYEVRWSKAMLCPNRDPAQDDHHRLNCSLCDSNGFIYFDPIADIRMHFASFGARQLFMPEGRYHPGQVSVTALPAHKLSFWDKLELTHSVARFSEVKPTAGRNYKLKYPVVTLTHIVHSNGAVINPTTVTINPDGSLTFATAPATGFLGFSYQYRPVYIVMDMLHHVRDRRQTLLTVDKLVEFPTQVMAKLDFLVRDESAD